MKHSPLQLMRYLVPEISCAANPSFDPEKPFEAGTEQLSVNAVVTQQKAPEQFPGRSWTVEMTISQELKEGQNFPYKFEISLVGFFACFDGLPATTEEERYVRVNGSSMLYGTAREIIRTMTARGPWGEIFLPSISFCDNKETPQIEQATPAPKAE